ncbi:MAG: hypothetical protein GC162_07630 [Planctomycetes bacterium]|nr:hypothetical protein [Planctomycetota bacterium]
MSRRDTRLDAATMELIHGAVENRLEAAQWRELEAKMADDDHVRRTYLMYLSLQMDLSWTMNGQDTPAAQATTTARPVAKRSRGEARRLFRPWMGLAAAIALIGAAAAIVFHHPGESVRPTGVPRMAVAMLTDMGADAQWSDANLPTQPGSDLAAGAMELTSGSAQIMFENGAVVTLFGPARFQVIDRNLGRLDEGVLTAFVPERAHGFTVTAPNEARVIDLGTRFAMVVDRLGRTSIQVMAGRVRLANALQNAIFTVDESASIGVDGRIGPADSAALLLAARVAGETERGFKRWQTFSTALSRDPSIVAYYDFSDGAPELLKATGKDRGMDAEIDGPVWDEGRWPGKRALRFDGPGGRSHVALNDAASERCNFSGSFSVMAWFKVNRFTTHWQSLITKGDSSWRVHRNDNTDTLSFGTTANGDTDDMPASTPVNDGRWHLVTATYEAGDTPRKRLYIDGKLEAQRDLRWVGPNGWPVWIGNNAETAGRDDRAFDGLIGEAALFKRALSEREINEIYHVGRSDEEPAAMTEQGQEIR